MKKRVYAIILFLSFLCIGFSKELFSSRYNRKDNNFRKKNEAQCLVIFSDGGYLTDISTNYLMYNSKNINKENKSLKEVFLKRLRNFVLFTVVLLGIVLFREYIPWIFGGGIFGLCVLFIYLKIENYRNKNLKNKEYKTY